VTEDICQVTITAPEAGWLTAFVRSLVEDRLCASGQIETSIRSIYRWQGAVEDRYEARATLHTRTDLVPAIIEHTIQEHPYEVPAVVARPILATNPAYHRWILEVTRSSPPRL
jgi:periplasmic divalent cation tolerance protein